MSISSILIANRGEIAIRIARAAADLGLRSVSVFSGDDSQSLHVRATDVAHALPGRGAAAYLDRSAILAAARDNGCDALHPGYGFLSENAAFAQDCADAGLVFIGPTPETLAELGDKSRARDLASRLNIPMVPGSGGAVTLDEARAFMAGLGAKGSAMIKAIAGGGGRGMRAVHAISEIDDAYARCRSEALSARHIEVQIARRGAIIGGAMSCTPSKRDCTLQRRNQKLIEIAPAPRLDRSLRAAILDAAVTMAKHFPYRRSRHV